MKKWREMKIKGTRGGRVEREGERERKEKKESIARLTEINVLIAIDEIVEP